MNSTTRILRRRIAAPVWLLLALGSTAWAQTPAVDPLTLARYDTNKNGVLDPAERDAMEAAQTRKVPVDANAGTVKDEAVVLSPFEVVEDTKGYYASNTMSGTRFNSKLEDLGASMSIVTKEQMMDFGMLDINDVFNYTANTEGTGSFTDFSVDRNGSVSDNVQLNPNNANRVRGLGSANISLGNVETSGRTPVDPLSIDSLEISRGPNSTIFGNGGSSGSVNLVPASANVSRDRSTFALRADSYDGYRTSLDLNRVLKKGVLAIRVNGSFQHDGFVRQPSGVNSTRYNGMVKYQPFKKTTLTASYSYYHMNGNRPNFAPPRDNVSYWLSSGRPGWDPVAQVVHVNGTTLGPFTADTGIPDYFTRSYYGAKSGQTLAEWYIGQGGLEYMQAQGSQTNANNPDSPATGPRLMSSNSMAGAAGGVVSPTQPLFSTTPTVSSSFYDWQNINIAAVNRVMDRTTTGSVQLDQNFVNTTRNRIDLQVSFLRERSLRYKRNLLGDANDNGISGQLFVDVNEKMLDGTANPYFGRPYLGVAQPWTQLQPLRYDTTRAQLAYKLDLSHEKNLLRWLGTHQFSVYDEFKYRTSRTRSYRDAIVDAHTWIPAGTMRGSTSSPFSQRGYYRFYLGDNVGSNIDYAPTDFSYGTYNFIWGNFAGGPINREPVTTGQVATNNSTSGTLTVLKTKGGVVQSHFLDERIVTTFGMRQDGIFSKSNASSAINPDGLTFNPSTYDHWVAGDYTYRSGKTKQGGVVVRPFQGWGFIKRMDSGPASHFVVELLNGLSVIYNKSDSFTPQSPAQDILLQPIGNQTGTGKDYGFALNMFDNKFVLRFNRYETLQRNVSGGDANTLSRRVLHYDIRNPANHPVFELDDQADAWTQALHPTWTTEQIDADVARQIGIPLDVQAALFTQIPGLNAPNTQLSKGTEIELNYNPTRFWTLAASGTDTQAFVSGAGTALATWINQRMPIWTTIKDPRGADHLLGTPDDATPVNWWTTNYGGNQTAAQNYAVYVGGALFDPPATAGQAEDAAPPL